MVSAPYRQLVDHVRERLGDGLLGAVYYSTEDDVFQDSGAYELLYLRDDLSVAGETDLESVMAATRMESLGRTIREHREGHDELVSSVNIYAGVTEVYFFRNGEGVALAVRPAEFLSHNAFLRESLDILGFDETELDLPLD